MADRETVSIYLEEPLHQSAVAGTHNFINLVVEVLETARFRVEFHALPITGNPPAVRSLSHMVSPPNERGLVFRRVYHYPFWQIDAVAQRWHWDTARAPYDPGQTAPDAARFYQFWQKRLFGDAPHQARRGGFVYVPLQGHLRRQRLFQSCTPLEMVGHVVAHSDRKVIATLHPKESYGRGDLAALEALENQHVNLTVASGNMERYLQTCDYVVTQNSGVAFSGYFFGKAAMLFAPIDFHHIAVRADLTCLAEGFAAVDTLTPDYAHYIWWFWQDQSINAGRDDAGAKIAARLRRFGWDV